MKRENLIDYHVKVDKVKQQKRGKASLKETKPYFKYFGRNKGLVFAILLLLVASTICSLIGAVLGGRLLAAFTENFNKDEVIRLGLLVLANVLLGCVLNFVCNVLWNRLNTYIGVYIKRDLVKHINSLCQSCFDEVGSNYFFARLSNDAYRIQTSFLRIASDMITVLGGLGFLGYTFSLNIYVGLFLLAYVGLYLIVREVQVRKRNRNALYISDVMDEYGSLELENIKSMKDIKNINTTAQISQKIEQKNKVSRSLNYKFAINNNFWSEASKVTVAVMNCLFIVLCAYLIYNKQLMVAGFMIAYNYRGRIMGFASTLATMRTTLADFAVSAKRVNELYDPEKYPVETFGNDVLENPRGEVEFKNVKFSYVESMPVLDEVSFKIKPNSIASFVGESGCGKSTIVSLMNKLYALGPNDGEILIDGHNINDLTRNSLRGNVCVVSQNPYVFDMSVRDNLLLARPDAPDDELWNVLEKVEFASFVRKLEHGLDSRLGENGIKLSGGQKQRLAIARAILKDAKVIVFDEATSALDNDNQAKIKAVMKNLSKTKTIIMVAHRLSTVIDSDDIFFISGGKVLKSGTHDYLMENCPEYKHLYEVEDKK